MRLVVNCWESKGRKRSVRLPVMAGSGRKAKELRAAIRSARDGTSDGVLWRASPADTNRGPERALQTGRVAAALVIVGTGVAFFVSANAVLLTGVIGACVLAGWTWEWWRRSTVVEVRGDGHLVVRSPGRTRDVALTAYRRVTVKVERGESDFTGWDLP